MTVHSAVLFLHVLAAIVLVGHTLFTPFIQAAVRNASSMGAMREWLRLARDSGRANPLAALALLASGLQLASGRWSEGWIHVSLVTFVVNSVLAVKVVKATGQRLAALATTGDGPITPELEAVRSSARWSAAVGALMANDLATLFLMTAQPSLLASIAVTIGAHAAVLAVHALRSRRHAEAGAAHAAA